ncbi:hypothetical protein, partial [Bifidobacterium subtile]
SGTKTSPHHNLFLHDKNYRHFPKDNYAAISCAVSNGDGDALPNPLSIPGTSPFSAKSHRWIAKL